VSVINGGERPQHSRFGGVLLRPAVLRAAPFVVFMPAILALAIALGSPAPLAMKLLPAPQRSGASEVHKLAISVSNHSGKSLTPHFQTASTISGGFWHVLQGPHTLAPGATARYVLSPPNQKSAPPTGSPFSIEAVTSQPTTFSSARLTVSAPS
jgi:hypothetical protein